MKSLLFADEYGWSERLLTGYLTWIFLFLERSMLQCFFIRKRNCFSFIKKGLWSTKNVLFFCTKLTYFWSHMKTTLKLHVILLVTSLTDVVPFDRTRSVNATGLSFLLMKFLSGKEPLNIFCQREILLHGQFAQLLNLFL